MERGWRAAEVSGCRPRAAASTRVSAAPSRTLSTVAEAGGARRSGTTRVLEDGAHRGRPRRGAQPGTTTEDGKSGSGQDRSPSRGNRRPARVIPPKPRISRNATRRSGEPLHKAAAIAGKAIVLGQRCADNRGRREGCQVERRRTAVLVAARPQQGFSHALHDDHYLRHGAQPATGCSPFRKLARRPPRAGNAAGDRFVFRVPPSRMDPSRSRARSRIQARGGRLLRPLWSVRRAGQDGDVPPGRRAAS